MATRQGHAVQGGRGQLHLRRHGRRAEPDLQRQRDDARRDDRVQQDRRGRHLARRRQPAHGGELAERAGSRSCRASRRRPRRRSRSSRTPSRRTRRPCSSRRARWPRSRVRSPSWSSSSSRPRPPPPPRPPPSASRRPPPPRPPPPLSGRVGSGGSSASLAGLSQAAPPPTAPGGAGAVQAAESQIGVPYVWGGESPKGSASPGFDCSGLTAWSWGQVGVGLPHYSGAQMSDSTPVPVSDLQPGDLLFYGPGGSDHVAMYVGGGPDDRGALHRGLRLDHRPPPRRRLRRRRPALAAPDSDPRPPVDPGLSSPPHRTVLTWPEPCHETDPRRLPHRAARGPHLRHRPGAHVLVRVHLLRAAPAQATATPPTGSCPSSSGSSSPRSSAPGRMHVLSNLSTYTQRPRRHPRRLARRPLLLRRAAPRRADRHHPHPAPLPRAPARPRPRPGRARAHGLLGHGPPAGPQLMVRRRRAPDAPVVRDVLRRPAGPAPARAHLPGARGLRRLPDPHRDRAPRSTAGPTARAASATRRGIVLGTGMVLWGIERSLDEHLWLGEDGRLGSDLVQLAGLLLVAGGVVILVRTRSRWKHWLTTHHAPGSHGVPHAGGRTAGLIVRGLLVAQVRDRAERIRMRSPWRSMASASPSLKIQPDLAPWAHLRNGLAVLRLGTCLEPCAHSSSPFRSAFRPAPREGNRAAAARSLRHARLWSGTAGGGSGAAPTGRALHGDCNDCCGIRGSAHASYTRRGSRQDRSAESPARTERSQAFSGCCRYGGRGG